MRLHVAIAVAFVWAACQPAQRPAPAPSVSDSAPLSDCQAAEKVLTDLGCPEANIPGTALPDGGTANPIGFGAACAAALIDGRNWRADCLRRITSCAQVNAAYRTPVGVKCLN